ncbi:hypothetical protein CE91St51_19660 [[Clostridium] innocuum]|nr:hypothetical protein CE91St51_19660 [[Clostridium] innocuum]
MGGSGKEIKKLTTNSLSMHEGFLLYASFYLSRGDVRVLGTVKSIIIHTKNFQ